MERHLPWILLATVFLTAAVGLTLTLNEDSTGDSVADISCKSLPQFAGEQQNIVECNTPNGGCPAPYPEWKQYAFKIKEIDTCCCVRPKSDYQNAGPRRSLYQG